MWGVWCLEQTGWWPQAGAEIVASAERILAVAALQSGGEKETGKSNFVLYVCFVFWLRRYVIISLPQQGHGCLISPSYLDDHSWELRHGKGKQRRRTGAPSSTSNAAVAGLQSGRRGFSLLFMFANATSILLQIVLLLSLLLLLQLANVHQFLSLMKNVYSVTFLFI